MTREIITSRDQLEGLVDVRPGSVDDITVHLVSGDVGGNQYNFLLILGNQSNAEDRFVRILRAYGYAGSAVLVTTEIYEASVIACLPQIHGILVVGDFKPITPDSVLEAVQEERGRSGMPALPAFCEYSREFLPSEYHLEYLLRFLNGGFPLD